MTIKSKLNMVFCIQREITTFYRAFVSKYLKKEN